MNKIPPRPSRALWIQIVAVCLAVTLLGFFIVAYFITPNPTTAQSDLLRFLYPLLAGLMVLFISGEILLIFKAPLSGEATLTLSASAGLAIFIFVYVKGPYWYPGLLPAPTASQTPTIAPASSPSPLVVTPTPTSVASVTPTLASSV